MSKVKACLSYIEENTYNILKEQALKEKRPITFMINRLVENYCNELIEAKK